MGSRSSARRWSSSAFPAGSASTQVEHVLSELEARGARSRASVREVLDAIADRLAGGKQGWGAGPTRTGSPTRAADPTRETSPTRGAAA